MSMHLLAGAVFAGVFVRSFLWAIRPLADYAEVVRAREKSSSC